MNLWRTRLTRGQQTYAWVKKIPDGIPLDGGPFLRIPWVAHPQWYTPSFQSGFLAPNSLPADTYCLGGQTLTVTDPPPARSEVLVQPGQDLQAPLEAGCDVLLAPGRHEIRRKLRLLGGRLRGSGIHATYLVRLPDTSYANACLEPAADSTLADLTVVNPFPDTYTFHRSSPAENVSVERVRFEGGQFGEFPSPGLLVRDCTFFRCGVYKLTSRSLFHRCRFEHGGLSSRGAANLALLECEFYNGALGFASDGTPVQDCLFHGLHFSGLQGRDNGSENFLVEDGNFHHNLVTGLRVRTTEGCGLQFYESHTTNNLFWDFLIEAGSTTGRALWFHSSRGHDQSDNLFMCGEFRGGRCDFGPAATRNTLRQVALVSPRPSRGNQLSWYSPSWYAPQAAVAAAPGTLNRAESCTVLDLPAGWTAYSPNVLVS